MLWMQDRYPLGCDDVVLQKTPVTFDVSVWELFWPLMVGARLVVAAVGGHRDPVYLAGVIVAGMHTNEIFIENGRFHGKKIAEAIAESLARTLIG